MPRPALRSRSKRRVFVRVTTGTKLVHKIRKPAQATCGECGKLLQAVPRASKVDMHKLPKSQRRPERPYGGVLCSKCSRLAIKAKTRTS